MTTHTTKPLTLRHAAFIALVVCSLAQPAPAKDTAPPLLNPADVHIRQMIPPPPVKDSQIDADDRAKTEKIFLQRTEKERLRAARADNDSVFEFIDVLGPSFNASALPKTDALFKQVTAEVSPIIKKAKTEFARVRPDLGGKPLKGTPDDYSYPSGHATRAELWASLLEHAFPHKKAALEHQAKIMGHNRVILGYHYPADIEAGRIFGQKLADLFWASPAFQAAWQPVAKELATVR